MRIALMIASGSFDGPLYLEDAMDIVGMLESTGQIPLMSKWVTVYSEMEQTQHLLGMI